MRLYSEWARGLRATVAIKYWLGSYSLDVDGFARHLNPAPDGRCLRTLGAVLHQRLNEELVLAMKLAGCSAIGELTPDMIYVKPGSFAVDSTTV
jgi:hypothetical protein